ncbi:hypothetical protein F4859DRAFT_350934 [Xylaria cf. heliscus]|nr:hypothetical protein F4859DRAFT_350934 [Xylaria cf. heliscus]
MTSPTPSPIRQEDVHEIISEEHGRNANENKIIRLGFAAEDEYGDKELLLYEQNLLFVTPSSPQESNIYALSQLTGPSPSGEGTIGGQNGIVYLDYETLEELELHQTWPLRRVAEAKTIAVHWLSLCTQKKLKETLMTVYSQLRDIEMIIIVADHVSRCALTDITCHRTTPLKLCEMPRETILRYDRAMVNWSTVGQKLQEMIRDQAFWQECNRQYALGQILPVRLPHVPQVYLGLFTGGCEHQGSRRIPPQLPSLIRDLAPDPADIDELRNPAQVENPVFTNYSLQDLLN